MRQTAISNIISTLGVLITTYEDPKPQCLCYSASKFECDAMVLGALIKGSVKMGLWPLAPQPHIDISFHHLSKSIRGMAIPTLCNLNKRHHQYDSFEDYSGGSKHCCNVKGTIEASLLSLENQLCGLDLDAFRA
jgi:hypothetical protein